MTSKLVGCGGCSVKANGSCGRASPLSSLAYRPQTISRMSRSAWRTLLFPAAFAPYSARTGTSCFLSSGEIRQSDRLLSVDAFMLMMAASKQGGATVVIAKGEYRTYTIELKSHVHLHFEEGAVIRAARTDIKHSYVNQDGVGKGIKYIVTDDIRCYLTEYQAKKKSSKVTIDNIRRILSSFFSWLEDEDYILKSPVRRIHKVKTRTNIKETYSDEALELMRDNCTELRDLAMIDMLASTGMRVGEMVLLNREDIDFNERECVVFGKGDKERIVYFDARTKIHLQNYLNSRKDDNPALFVSLQSPYNRMNIGGIEVRLRQLGKRLGLNKVHPHKFRRTLATMAIDKGMPIEQLQQLLGHRRIDTTLQYAMVKQSNVKIAHRKYIG